MNITTITKIRIFDLEMMMDDEDGYEEKCDI
jgi:hypothetical protein